MEPTKVKPIWAAALPIIITVIIGASSFAADRPITLDPALFDQEPDPKILSIRPFSIRALAFAQHYARMSEQLHNYIGEPRVITTLAFEAHVVKDVSSNLDFLERGIQFAKAFRATRGLDFKPVVSEFSETYKIIKLKSAQRGLYVYGVLPFFENPPWKWGWNHLDSAITELESLYENMSAMNMHIFRCMTTPGLSPLNVYFKKAQEMGPDFDGWVEFPKDHNHILREAFHRLFLLKQSNSLEARKSLSWEFSVLMIAYEQIYAQKYYDQIFGPHEKLEGTFFVDDPLGRYHLANASWADFRVRFSLPLNQTLDLDKLDASTLLSANLRPGTIPDYYRSRIFSENSLRLLPPPAVVKNFKLAELHLEDSTLQKNSALRLLNENGCMGCHTHTQAGGHGVVGPDLSHVGSRLDRNFIETSILDPDRDISTQCLGADGCPRGIMPKNYGQALSNEQLKIVVDYLSNSR